ncbi:hypothetical protein QN372_19265 [Undibacterium sp. RTI2.1]|uniref:hypothetical protein n=1 Tax=unclassified Undibacterium TaxID=2630295 RepID=UPI002B223F05|nr:MULTISPECIES: hypothetical protein [unclassified Undibacterium]MEB0032893.1 hypothetical protein [Undibacterium sp. RTI2.1]MEB0118798.1 hypothetical protein [Undibacterium sp. RTI2.2]
MDELEVVLLKILADPAAFIVRARKNSVICANTHATKLCLNNGLAGMPMDVQDNPDTCRCWFSRQLDLFRASERRVKLTSSNGASCPALILK